MGTLAAPGFFLHRNNDAVKAVADTAKENLRDAPTFDYSKGR